MGDSSLESVVSLPLAKDPPLLWGMGLKDLIWPALSLAGDLLIWSHHPKFGVVEDIALAAVSAGGLIFGIVRVHSRSIPEWLVVIVLFYLHPRLYLP